jgi:hypothetical protein
MVAMVWPKLPPLELKGCPLPPLLALEIVELAACDCMHCTCCAQRSKCIPLAFR